MMTQIVITDLTRMHRGMVCIAGYDKDHQCIRHTLPPPGIPEQSLWSGNTVKIFPFALVEFDLRVRLPQPPHTEDWHYLPDSTRYIRTVYDRKTILSWSLYESVGTIFDQPIHDDFGFYVMDCQGPRSLGTVHPVEITRFIYQQDSEGTWDYRIEFVDGQGKSFKLKITDLTWHYYCNSLRGEDRDPTQIAQELTMRARANEVYLRIGLSRSWPKFPDRCYLQVNGIYTFPDYLDGKTFADFTRQESVPAINNL